MNKIIAKFVESKFITEGQGKIIEDGIKNKVSVIVSGHRSAGIRPFMANLMMLAKQEFKTVQVSGKDSLASDAECFLIPGIDGVNFEEIIQTAMEKDGASFISIKEPEHPYSIMKLLKAVYKSKGASDKKYLLIDCDKENDVPFVERITEVHINDAGKIVKKIPEGSERSV